MKTKSNIELGGKVIFKVIDPLGLVEELILDLLNYVTFHKLYLVSEPNIYCTSKNYMQRIDIFP